MPLNVPALDLSPDPRSVHHAREWVCDVLEDLGRPELVDAAALGISELVTNALLHANPPISVRVRGTRKHPRIEVHDGSRRAPEMTVDMTDADHLLATFGRGLGIVAMQSATWGAELVPDGKVVWFEPAKQPRLEGDLTGEVFDLDQTLQERLGSMRAAGPTVRVRMLHVPVQPWAQFRKWFFELARELRLLALAHGDDYPVTQELDDVFLQAEQEGQLMAGREQFDAAWARGDEHVDLDLQAPASLPATLARLLTTLERVQEFCRQERFLALAAPPERMALIRWWCGEFRRQAAGEEPVPWRDAA